MVMEWIVLSEHNKQGLEEKNVQIEEKVRKKRSQEDKIGRLKYHEVVTKKILGQNEQILSELRWIRRKFQAMGYSEINLPVLERFAVKDHVDLLIMERVREAGDSGVFPKDVAKASALSKYDLEYYDVSRRIVRMNKRLNYETGELLFEKRGHKWALTRFAFDIYGESEAEVARSIESVEESEK